MKKVDYLNSPCRSCPKLNNCNTSCKEFDSFFNISASNFVSSFGISDPTDEGYSILL